MLSSPVSLSFQPRRQQQTSTERIDTEIVVGARGVSLRPRVYQNVGTHTNTPRGTLLLLPPSSPLSTLTQLHLLPVWDRTRQRQTGEKNGDAAATHPAPAPPLHLPVSQRFDTASPAPIRCWFCSEILHYIAAACQCRWRNDAVSDWHQARERGRQPTTETLDLRPLPLLHPATVRSS